MLFFKVFFTWKYFKIIFLFLYQYIKTIQKHQKNNLIFLKKIQKYSHTNKHYLFISSFMKKKSPLSLCSSLHVKNMISIFIT